MPAASPLRRALPRLFSRFPATVYHVLPFLTSKGEVMISDSAFDFEVFRSQLANQESALAKIGSALTNLYCEPEQIRVDLANLESALGKTQARLLSVLSQLDTSESPARSD